MLESVETETRNKLFVSLMGEGGATNAKPGDHHSLE